VRHVLHTRLCDLLGIDAPIIQTAMGWVATPQLVAATCNAGAIGFLGAATMRPDEAHAAIERVKSLTDRPFGLNFLMEQPGADRIVDTLIEQGVRVASYSRSPNPDFMRRMKAAGVICIPTIGAVRHAVRAVELGADAVIAQGSEGGGHTGSVPTTLLLPQVVAAVKVPVVAAGGFRDGRGLVAALALGASGIAMGTRFLMTRESPVPEATKSRYVAVSVDDTVVTRKIDGLPQRVIRNQLVNDLERRSGLSLLVASFRNALTFRKMTGTPVLQLLTSAWRLRRRQGSSIAQILMAANAPVLVRTALVDGQPEQGIMPSGQVVGLIDDLPRCADLIRRILDEAEQALAGLESRQDA
jgi:NAD(P)H-dependent flavin oxidoreductase YrpB (nitropropane dioxygenase family)